MTNLQTGATIKIKSYKHNGQLHRVWEENRILKRTDTAIIGINDQTRVTESDGRTFQTKEPAVCYFPFEYWFNIIGMLRQDGVHYYCNLSSPFACDAEGITYIDYDLDVYVYPDMTYDLLDEEEFEKHKQEMYYPAALEPKLRKHRDDLLEWIKERKGPFSPHFIEQWYEWYLSCSKDFFAE